MTSLDPDVRAYYEQGLERDRLVPSRPGGWWEHLRTADVLARALPSPPATVLDVGGAAGTYAVPLAAGGYDVTLVDPVPLHVEQARAAGVDAQLGDARRLAQPDGAYDAVLLLGPLYHLVDGTERLAALREARRVLRPGGVVVAAAVCRYSALLDGVLKGYLADPTAAEVVERGLRDGEHRPVDATPGFTTAYFHTPRELAEEVAAAGFDLDLLAGVEGPFWLLGDLGERLADPARREVLLAAARRVEEVPELQGASSHLLAVGRVPTG